MSTLNQAKIIQTADIHQTMQEFRKIMNYTPKNIVESNCTQVRGVPWVKIVQMNLGWYKVSICIFLLQLVNVILLNRITINVCGFLRWKVFRFRPNKINKEHYMITEQHCTAPFMRRIQNDIKVSIHMCIQFQFRERLHNSIVI